jgi:hypothetical protein
VKQACNSCGHPVRFCGGHLCASCRSAVKKEALKPGSIPRMIAARRAAKLIEMVAEQKQEEVKALKVERPVVISLAVDQLAQAWGVRRA